MKRRNPGARGYSARFVLEAGKPTELKVIQPTGMFTLKRASGPS